MDDARDSLSLYFISICLSSTKLARSHTRFAVYVSSPSTVGDGADDGGLRPSLSSVRPGAATLFFTTASCGAL